MVHGDDGRGGAPGHPDGPPPAREQLPLPRRRRQAHIEPHLRASDTPGGGTPFAAFTADDADETPCPGPGDTTKDASADRAAAFHAGASRGRGAGPRRADPRRAGPAAGPGER